MTNNRIETPKSPLDPTMLKKQTNFDCDQCNHQKLQAGTFSDTSSLSLGTSVVLLSSFREPFFQFESQQPTGGNPSLVRRGCEIWGRGK